jgi:heme exporter protein A
MPAIEAQGLEKRFGAVAALCGVDLEVAGGQALAVLGPNGAGKSTLLKIFAGLVHPSGGSLVIGGRRHSASNREDVRARVGFVGHATLLYSELTARENLLFACRLYGVALPGERADALLEEVGLADWGERRVGVFSRGMSQRLAIARALVHDPSLLLLDEPYSGLDRGSADRLAARLGALREGGRTLVLITHDLRQACAIGTSAIVLARGRVVHRNPGPRLVLDELEAACAQATEVGGAVV